jgi:hypothetical protein
MRVHFLAQQVVGVNGAGNVSFMDTNGDSHHHVLWSLNDFAVNFEKVCSLKSFVSEEIVVPVSLVHNGIIKCLLVSLDDVIDILCNKCSILSIVDISVQGLHTVCELRRCLLLKLRHADSSC